MVACNQIRKPLTHDSGRDSQLSSRQEEQFSLQPKLKLNCDDRRPVMEGCLCCCNGSGSGSGKLVDSKQQHHESSLTFASTTMETDESSKMVIMNRSFGAVTTAATTKPARWFGRNRINASVGGGNSNLYLDNESVNLSGESWTNHTNVFGATKYMKVGFPGFSWRNCCWPQNSFPRQAGMAPISRSPICLTSYLWFRMCLLLMMSVCLAHAGFWTFYLPNFLKASGYRELNNMIESVERQINSTKDAHADAVYFWGIMKDTDENDDENEYYPEESACEEVFPLFRDKAIQYADIDYQYYLEPFVSYREHLLEMRDSWFPDGPKTKNILPRQYELDLYKVDLEIKIESFNFLTKDPRLRKMREEMVNIWRNVKRNLDDSLTCIRLRYSYQHVAEDINQFALEMNLRSLHQAMEMLEAAYKRVDLYREQDRVAIERIHDDVERVQDLVMKD